MMGQGNILNGQESVHRLPLRRQADVECQESDDELLVMDVEADCVHCLSASMATIWKLCDGTRSVDQIVKSLTEVFDCSQVDGLYRTVAKAVDTLADLDLLMRPMEMARDGGGSGSSRSTTSDRF